MKKLLLSTLLAMNWLLFACPVSAEELVLQEKPVRIVTSSSPAIFPEAWRKPSIAPEGRALSGDQIEKALSILKRALAKYPPGVLATNLRNVYVLAELRHRNVITSGTNSRTGVYLKFGEEHAGYTAAHIEATFHAEFSSILLRNHPALLDADAWRDANPEGFAYLGDGVEAVKQGKAGRKPQEALLEQGFLSEYAGSTLENDFNGIAAKLFTGDTSLWSLAAKHPRIQRKLDLSLAFYQKLDPMFSEAFFKCMTTPGGPSAKGK